MLCPQTSDLLHSVFVFSAPYFLLLSELPSSPATAQVPLLLQLYQPPAIGTMLYCPNPSCTRHAGKTKKPFSSDKSFSHHLQQSSACKAFLLVEQMCLSAPTTQNPSKQASYSSQLFKKQWLRFNPTFSQQQHIKKANDDIVKDEVLDDDVYECSADMESSFACDEYSSNFVDIIDLPASGK